MSKPEAHAMDGHIASSAHTSSPSHDRRTRRRVTWILALSLMGYPLLGTLVALTPYPSFVAAIPVRLSVVLLSLSLLVHLRPRDGFFFSFRSIRLTPLRCTLLLFWLVYLCRLMWDWQVQGMPEAGTALLFFSVVSLIPSLALLGIAPWLWDANAFARLAFFAGAATSAIAVGATLLGLAGERSLIEQTERLAFDTVNPITYGYVAATTILAGLIGWSEDGRRRPLWTLGFVVLGCAAALASLQMSASKGPVAALAISLLVLGVSQRRFRWVLAASIPLAIAFVMVPMDGMLGQRFSDIDEDLSTINRLMLLADAAQQFVDNPFFGHAFIESESQTYPHNPLLEAGMATGVLGFTLYLMVFLASSVRLFLWIAGRAPGPFLALLALQYLIGENISGSLYASGSLWIIIAMIIAVTTVPHSISSKAETTHPEASANTAP